jgi:serine/threonine protein kinase
LAKLKTLRDGRYTLIRAIGTGSQAETYEARDSSAVERPGRLVDEWQRYVARARRFELPQAHGLVAIKCFHVGKAKAWKDVELAEREARTLASLTHPNLPRYIEHFEEEGALYLVMEMVEGESLAALRARQRVSSVAEVTRMLHDIAAALRYLHGRAPAVIHRDLKPGNIIRRHDGSYALVDFGAVRDRLKPGGGSTVVGTFGYMAPEQFQGRASPKSDLYGLAATALVMLTGVEPEDLPHVGLGIDVAKALPGSAPAPLVRALASMLNPDPDHRASTIDEALALLRETKETPRREEPKRKQKQKQARREARAREKQRKREEHEDKRRRRAAARSRRAAPLVPRVVGQLALLVAQVAVWVSVGLAVPLILAILALVFGDPLLRAAAATRRAASRSQASLRRGSAWLSGYREEDPPRHRIGEWAEQVRINEGERSTEPDESDAMEAEEEDDPRRRAVRRS